MTVETGYIICIRCSFKFERESVSKFCSNCFVCSGCEIYYCPLCDEEIIITPVKRIKDSPEEDLLR